MAAKIRHDDKVTKVPAGKTKVHRGGGMGGGFGTGEDTGDEGSIKRIQFIVDCLDSVLFEIVEGDRIVIVPSSRGGRIPIRHDKGLVGYVREVDQDAVFEILYKQNIRSCIVVVVNHHMSGKLMNITVELRYS